MRNRKRIKDLIKKTVISHRISKAKVIFGKDLLYQNGVSFFKSEEQKRKWYFNPYIILCLSLVFGFREFSSLIANNEMYSTLVGDHSFKFKLRRHLNFLMGTSTLFTAGLHLCHLWYWINNRPNYSVDIDSNQNRYLLDLIDWKYKAILKLFLIENRVFIAFFCGICSFGLLYINLSLTNFLIFGVFWSILFSIYGFIGVVGFWHLHLFYFLYVTKYFVNRLKLINYRLICLNEQGYVISYRKGLISILSQIDKTHRDIKESDNFWSKYILLNWILISMGLSAELVFLIYTDPHFPILGDGYY